MILEEVVKHRRNIFTMWFDYKKAFDMIPHKWLLEAMMLFILCVNPLSHLLNQLPGYKIGPPGNRTEEISHLFFVDDLKTFAQDEQHA